MTVRQPETQHTTVRKPTISRALAALAALAVSACSLNVDDAGDDAFADGVACAAVEGHLDLVTLFELPRDSESDEAELVGLCSLGAGCHPGSPLMLGADHAFFVRAPALATEPPPVVALVSSDPDVVSLAAKEPVCSYVSGALQAAALGSASVELQVDGEVIDRFPFEVAAPASIEAGLTTLGDWEQEAPAVGGEVMLTAIVRDGEGRALVAGDAITWVVADDGVLGADGSLTGHMVSLEALKAGTTKVIAAAGELDTVVTITVAP